MYLDCKDDALSFIKFQVVTVINPYKGNDVYVKVAGVATRDGKKITPSLRGTLNLPSDMYKSTTVFYHEVGVCMCHV